VAISLAATAWTQAPIGSEFQVNQYTTGTQRGAAVATDPNGRSLVVWESSVRDGPGERSLGIYGRFVDPSGSPEGNEFQVNTYTPNGHRAPAVAAVGGGDFVVVWVSQGQDGSGDGIFGRYVGSGGPSGLEFMANTTTLNRQEAPAVASDAAGNFVVAWHDGGYPAQGADGSHYGVFAQRFAAGGARLGFEFQVNTHTIYSQIDPAVASDASGNFVVVWESFYQDGSAHGVFAQRFAASGLPLGSEFRVNTYTLGVQSEPAVASDANGSFVVTWGGRAPGDPYGVWGQRYDATGNTVGAEFPVNASNAWYQRMPSVAYSTNGDFVVAWAHRAYANNDYEVFARRFDASGVPGGQFRVNSTTTFRERAPSIAADGSGGFTVIWTSVSPEDSGTVDVFGQHFGPLPDLIFADGFE
jgi:hypothetical protein